MIDTRISVVDTKDAIIRLLRSYGQHVSADAVEALTPEEIWKWAHHRPCDKCDGTGKAKD